MLNTVRFGDFEADFHSGELRKSGIRIRIQEQPLRVLQALLESPGQLVTREELQKRLWPDVSYLDFEHGLNMAVKKLRTALNDSADSPRYVETLARKGYRFIAPLDTSSPPEVDTAPAPPPMAGGKPISGRLVTVAIVFIGVVASLALWSFRPPQPSTQVSLVLSGSGRITYPRLSPDGRQLLYTLEQQGEKRRIWLKSVDTTAPPRRLTDDNDPVHSEDGGEWIPDGSGISFNRYAPGEPGATFVVPTSGGYARKLIAFGLARGYSWMPDAKSFVMSIDEGDGRRALYKVDVANGQRVQLVPPPAGLPNTSLARGGDILPSVSPDGTRVAFIRGLPNTSALMVTPSGGGEAVRVAKGFSVNQFTWTADSRDIVFTTLDASPSWLLYRVRIPDGQPTRLPFSAPGANVAQVTASRAGGRLVYVLPQWRLRIWRFPLVRDLGSPTLAGTCVAESPGADQAPEYAPDGHRFAFASDRSGNNEIYMARVDGKQVVQLTSFGKGIAGTPRWSPDGRRIAFDARPGDHAQIFVIDSEGGKPQPLTGSTDDAVMPEWSGDGKSIYYTLIDANGHSDIWRVAASGGAATRITTSGAWFAFPSPDGALLFTARRDQPGIWSAPPAGGPQTLVAADATRGLLAHARSGFYYVSPTSLRQVRYYSYARKTIDDMMVLPHPVEGLALAVSPDETEILATINDGYLAQVMLARDFR